MTAGYKMQTAAVCRHRNRYQWHQSAPPPRSPRRKPRRDRSTSAARSGLPRGSRGIAPKEADRMGSLNTHTRCSGLAGTHRSIPSIPPARYDVVGTGGKTRTSRHHASLDGKRDCERSMRSMRIKASSLPAINPSKIAHATREAASKRKSDDQPAV